MLSTTVYSPSMYITSALVSVQKHTNKDLLMVLTCWSGSPINKGSFIAQLMPVSSSFTQQAETNWDCGSIDLWRICANPNVFLILGWVEGPCFQCLLLHTKHAQTCPRGTTFVSLHCILLFSVYSCSSLGKPPVTLNHSPSYQPSRLF